MNGFQQNFPRWTKHRLYILFHNKTYIVMKGPIVIWSITVQYCVKHCSDSAKIRITIWAHKGHYPDSKIHGANMGPTWGRQDPGGPHVRPMNFAIWVYILPSSATLSVLCNYFTENLKCHDRTALYFRMSYNYNRIWYTFKTYFPRIHIYCSIISDKLK